MTFRPFHGWSTALASYGWLIPTILVLALASQYYGATQLPVPLPGDTTVKMVPATGEQGYPVAEFCKDPLTQVYRYLIPPLETSFSAAYNLSRIRGGVQELVDVYVYADANREPKSTRYDSANNPSTGFVSKAALQCIVSKAR